MTLLFQGTGTAILERSEVHSCFKKIGSCPLPGQVSFGQDLPAQTSLGSPGFVVLPGHTANG